MLSAFISLLLPPRCAACRAPSLPADPFCEPCAATLVECPPGCAVCGLPVDFHSEVLALKARRCPRCAGHPPAFARAHAPWLFGGALAEGIHRLKYGRAYGVARPLGRLLASTGAPMADLIAPIPLHKKRLRERGFDQALLLARTLSSAWKLPLEPRLLRRIRETRPQVGLDTRAREANVRGAFLSAKHAQGKRVLLVDDVLTTGATAAACARALKEAGARRVEVLALARAI